MGKLLRVIDLVSTVGFFQAFRVLYIRKLYHKIDSTIRMKPSILKHHVYVRPKSSDAGLFDNIFAFEEYACLNDLEDVGLVLDCGANVGYSSAYFLSRFPTCTVVAVEPDDGNFEALLRNTSPYGDRIHCIQAGVWSQEADLAMVEEPYRGGREVTRQVRICRPGETSYLHGIDVGTLMAQAGADRISILKMDIEGAEAVVFADGYEEWIDKVDTIAIELHDDSVFGMATPIFFEAIADQGFSVSQSGELTICRRPAEVHI